MGTNPAKRRRNAATCDTAVLQRFVDAVLKVEPMATGEAVGIQKAGETVVSYGAYGVDDSSKVVVAKP